MLAFPPCHAGAKTWIVYLIVYLTIDLGLRLCDAVGERAG